MRAIATAVPVRPSKLRLQGLFDDLLTRIDLDRVIPRQVRCENGIVSVGGERLDLRAYRLTQIPLQFSLDPGPLTLDHGPG